MRPDQVHSLRQTHRAITTAVPLLTAALTVSHVVLANMERQSRQEAAQDAMQNAMRGMGQETMPLNRPAQLSQAGQFAYPYALAPQVTRVVPVVSPAVQSRVVYSPRRLTVFAYLGTLLSRVLLVLLGMVLVATIVGVYFASDPTWRAIELTGLVLLILYLVERVARARRA
jgi:hypothetical protein